ISRAYHSRGDPWSVSVPTPPHLRLGRMADERQRQVIADAAIVAIDPICPAPNGDRELLGQAIAARLREAILDGRLAPGTPIRQEALAQQLGTSRIPVREALRQLESEGLLTLVPHSGAQ